MIENIYSNTDIARIVVDGYANGGFSFLLMSLWNHNLKLTEEQQNVINEFLDESNIDEIFKQIEKDFEVLSEKAARSAAIKAQKDISKKADQFIKEYYASYSPKWYHRTYALYDLVEDYYKETDKNNGITIEFGITYNPSKLSGVHRSYSPYHQGGGAWISRTNKDKFDFNSGNNGIPQPEWITDNFLKGIHPSGKLGDDGGQCDAKNPDAKMQDFFNKELESMVNQYISTALWEAVSKYF